MNINIKKWNPWDWFKHEDNAARGNVPIRRQASPSLFPGDALWNMHRELDRMFDQIFTSFGNLPRIFDHAGMLRPNVDIKETEKDYQIAVEIPGVDEKDVKLELANGVLTVKGEKKHEKAEDNENYYCVERSYGSFCRTLSLPSDADENGIDAKFKGGVLTISVPRRQVAKLKKEDAKVIDIKRPGG